MTDRIKETAAQYRLHAPTGRQQLYERVRRILDRLPDKQLEDLPSMDDLGLLGEIESRLACQAASENALGRALSRGRKARRQLINTAEMLPIERAAELLDIQPGSVRKRIQRGGLLAIKQGQHFLLPAFQFRDSSTSTAVRKCLAALDNLGEWTRLDWFMTPHPDLDGQTPADQIRRSPEAVIAAAKRFGQQGGT